MAGEENEQGEKAEEGIKSRGGKSAKGGGGGLGGVCGGGHRGEGRGRTGTLRGRTLSKLKPLSPAPSTTPPSPKVSCRPWAPPPVR